MVANGVLGIAGALTVTTAMIAWLAGQTLSTVLLAWYQARRLDGFGRPDRALMRRSLTFGTKSHLSHVISLGNWRLDQWFVGGMAGSRELGYYSVAVSWDCADDDGPTRATGASRARASSIRRISWTLVREVRVNRCTRSSAGRQQPGRGPGELDVVVLRQAADAHRAHHLASHSHPPNPLATISTVLSILHLPHQPLPITPD